MVLKSLIVFIFLFSYLGCKNKDKESLSLFSSLAECTAGNLPLSADCQIKTSNLYYYDLVYGGRGNTITGPLNGLDNVLSVNLPTGWYSAVTVNFSSAALTTGATNIKNGVNIFGTVGSFASSAAPACDLFAVNGLQSANCSAAVGNFLYSTAYNGRATDCTNINNGSPNANCWVGPLGVGLNLETVPAAGSPANCSVNGQQGLVCSAAISTYFYNNQYGGRALDCISGYNLNACWVTVSGKFLTTTSDPCVDNNYNSLVCGTQPGRYVYTASFGGRNVNCLADNSGNCWVSQPSKPALETNLTADKIKIGQTIFGVTGTFAGSGDWPSTAHRDQSTNAISMVAESSVHAANGSTPNLPGGYRQISSITKDDDGLFSTEVTSVSRIGWGSISCGINQNTLAARISDCATVFGANAIWDGGVNGNAGQVRWKLVSRSGNINAGQGREVWQDEKTKLNWSSLVSRNLNWCKAVGSSNNSLVAAGYRENDAQNFCNNQTYQNNSSGNTISACFEGPSGFMTTDADINNLAKAGLAITGTISSPAVAWRLPTMNDYEVAEAHGIRFVMPDMGSGSTGSEWMATTYSIDKSKAWTFASDTGLHSFKNRNLTALTRCVGR